MTEKEVIMEVIGFFIVPGEREEDEQQHFEKIFNFRLVSEREDERQYELKNKIERLEVLKQKMIEFKKYKKTPIIVSKDGKVVEINPEEITTHSNVYKSLGSKPLGVM